MNNELLLLSGRDIPFREMRINIHQPKIWEISLVGEEGFQFGSRLLNFSKELLDVEDKTSLQNVSDFEIFMSMINDKSQVSNKVNVIYVLNLLFPDYNVKIKKDEIMFEKKRHNDSEPEFFTSLNMYNFQGFKDIISQIFCLNDSLGGSDDKNYNPADDLAKKIAEKLEKRKKQLADKKNEGSNKTTIYSRFISILAVGEKKSINDLMEYTVFQLYDEFKRFQMKQDFDIYIQAKMAGVSDLDDVKNWMDDIHS